FRLPPNSMPNRIAVKTTDPSRVRSISYGDAIAKFVHEIRHWVSYRHSPFIVAPFYTEVVHGWPYVVMPYCECTMRQYIDRSVPNTGYPEALALLVQVICGLEFARQRGLLAHQDLKPENVLLQNLDSRLAQPHDYPFHWRAKLADFGMANGYMELKVPWGSRPYLAPEQYRKDADLSAVDVFACGVMLHELITGKHPIGEATSDIWPIPKPGKSSKWAHETPWKKWAHSENKAVFSKFKAGNDLRDLIQSCLSTNPVERPSLCAFRESLLDALKRCDARSYETLLMLLAYYQSAAIHSEAINTESDLQRYQFERIDRSKG
ncbi:MAG TPA: protein kinase, partial [Sedimentisphaerales bacterium]|nr:protein kinase [Sedimentisphaerales bacterium]